MNTIRALVVDDEKPSRDRLQHLLTRDTRVEFVGCCASGAEVLELGCRIVESARRVITAPWLSLSSRRFLLRPWPSPPNSSDGN
jgi:hypothetical protein